MHQKIKSGVINYLIKGNDSNEKPGPLWNPGNKLTLAAGVEVDDQR